MKVLIFLQDQTKPNLNLTKPSNHLDHKLVLLGTFFPLKACLKALGCPKTKKN